MSGPIFYEDATPGSTYETGGIVVTESHVVQFAGLSGDFFDLHMDDTFARELGFPRRVAHGLLGLILIDGLKNRAEHRFAGIASLSWQWHFRQPIFIGDRIAGKVTVLSKRRTKRDDRALVTIGLRLANQDGIIVQEGENLLMVRTRSAAAE